MPDLPLTAVDIAAIVIVVLSALFAMVRGFTRELILVLCWVGAGIVAWYGYPRVRPTIANAIPDSMITDVVTALLVFFVPLVVFRVFGGLFANGVDRSGLSAFDKILGLVFGVARGAFLVCCFFLVGNVFLRPEMQPDWLKKAYFRPQMERGAALLQGFLPEDLRASAERAAVDAAKRTGLPDVLPRPTPKPGTESSYSDATRKQMDALVAKPQ